MPSRTLCSVSSLILVTLLVCGSAVAAQSPSPPSTTSPSTATPTVASDAVVRCPTPGDPAAPVATDVRPARVRPAPDASALGTWAGTWDPMPAAPITGRAGAATGVSPYVDAMVVWSGRATDGSLLWDGAIYHADTATWENVEASPLEPRTDFAFVVGGEGSFFVWGGVTPDGRPMADGAYMLGADDVGGHPRPWIPVPEAPLPAGPAMASGDVRNWVFVTASGTDPTAGPGFALRQGPTGPWAGPTAPLAPNLPVEAPPVPTGVGYEVITPTMDRPLFLSYQADGTAVVSIWDVLDGWARPRSVPLPATGACPAIDLPWLGWIRADAEGDPVGLIARAHGGGWSETTTPPREALTEGVLLWAPGRLIVADALLAYRVSMGRWSQLPALPDGPRTGVSAAWMGGRLYLWGGRSPDGSVADTGWVFTPELPPETFRLPGGRRAGYGDCGGEPVPTSIRLRADLDDPSLVWFRGGGRRYEATWPDGYTVTFGARTVIRDPDGRVAARVGDRLRDIDLGYCPTNQAIHFG